jgi:hypothetical protein
MSESSPACRLPLLAEFSLLLNPLRARQSAHTRLTARNLATPLPSLPSGMKRFLLFLYAILIVPLCLR